MYNFNKTINCVVIDADGCPVAKLAAKISRQLSVRCRVVCDTSHLFNESELFGAEVVTVSKGSDSADFRIVNTIGENDIVVTQDYGLAAMCLARRAVPIDQNGRIYTDENISGLLESRAANKRLMRSGKHIKGPSKRTPRQNEDFEKTLRRLLENAEV